MMVYIAIRNKEEVGNSFHKTPFKFMPRNNKLDAKECIDRPPLIVYRLYKLHK